MFQWELLEYQVKHRVLLKNNHKRIFKYNQKLNKIKNYYRIRKIENLVELQDLWVNLFIENKWV